IGLLTHPQLSSMPATSLPPTIGQSSSASSMLLQLSSPRWQRPLTTVAPAPQASAVAPQAPPAPQLAALTHWFAMQVPPPVHELAVPGAVHAVPAFVELVEQRPAAAPAVQTLLHSSSPSSTVRQPPPGQSASRTQEAPGLPER